MCCKLRCIIVCANREQAKSIAIPAMTHKDRWMGPWEKAQAMADAIRQFDKDTQAFAAPDTHLKSIRLCLSNLNLDVADVISFVFKDYFRIQEERVNDGVQPSNEVTVDEPVTDEWFEIEGLLKHRKKKGKDEYLVKWKGTDEQTWQKREDISEPALQHFYATRKTKKRRRRT
jgi:hypothetical protein